MTNYPFQNPQEFRDIESINAYQEWCTNGRLSRETFWPCLTFKSRDNARTPMQWDDTANAGFTAAKPWIAVNPNYKEINARAETNDPDSVFHYYKKLIALRRQYPVIVYGKYELLLEDSEQLFVYTRTYENEKLLTVCSFSEQECSFQIPEEFQNASCIITNTNNLYQNETLKLKPYEAFVLYTCH